MGCTGSKRRVGVKDDGQFSIPNPFSTDEDNKGNAEDFADFKAMERKEGRGLPPLKPALKRPPPRMARGGKFSQSMRTLDIHSKPPQDARTPAAPKRQRKIVMLGQIGRSHTERVLSTRQRRNLRITPGLLKNARGVATGRIEDDGTWLGPDNARRGVFKTDGTVRSFDGTVLASIEPQTGNVLNSDKRAIGEIRRDGSVRHLNLNIGHVTADGVAFDTQGKKLGSCDAGPEVSGFIHFFSNSPDSLSPGSSSRRHSRRGHRS